MNKTEKRRAQKKIEIAIDKLIDIQDSGLGNDAIARALEILNSINFES